MFDDFRQSVGCASTDQHKHEVGTTITETSGKHLCWKIKKIKILKMGRVCCWLRVGGGLSGYYSNILEIGRTSYRNSPILDLNMSDYNLYVWNILCRQNANKRPFVWCCFFLGRYAGGYVRQIRKSDGNFLSLAKKTIHFLVTALSHATLYIRLTTQKTPYLSAGRGHCGWQYQLFFIANCLRYIRTFREFGRVICQPVDV